MAWMQNNRCVMNVLAYIIRAGSWLLGHHLPADREPIVGDVVVFRRSCARRIIVTEARLNAPKRQLLPPGRH